MKLQDVQMPFEKYIKSELVKLRMQLGAGKPFKTHHITPYASTITPSSEKRNQIIVSVISDEILHRLDISPKDLAELRHEWIATRNKFKHPGPFSREYEKYKKDGTQNTGNYIAYDWLLGATKPYVK